MARIDAEAVQDEHEAPKIRLRIDADDPAGRDRVGGGPLTLALTVEEAMAVRNALNRVLNALGLPEQD